MQRHSKLYEAELKNLWVENLGISWNLEGHDLHSLTITRRRPGPSATATSDSGFRVQPESYLQKHVTSFTITMQIPWPGNPRKQKYPSHKMRFRASGLLLAGYSWGEMGTDVRMMALTTNITIKVCLTLQPKEECHITLNLGP